jgi:hypothetical protein
VLPYEIAAEARGLLRFLLVWLISLSADPSGAQWGRGRRGLLSRVGKATGVAANLRHANFGKFAIGPADDEALSWGNRFQQLHQRSAGIREHSVHRLQHHCKR